MNKLICYFNERLADAATKTDISRRTILLFKFDDFKIMQMLDHRGAYGINGLPP
jgi:hypothetical protein